MMVMPSKENRQMRKKLDPWVLYNPNNEKHYLDSKAPEEIKDIYLRYREENGLEEFWDA